jgi:hypothetical protein
MHEADEPDAVVDFLDSNGLTSQTSAEIDLLAIQTQPSAICRETDNAAPRLSGP